MRALLSVSDKNGVVDFAKELISLGYELISTGGTYKTIRDSELEIKEVTEVTKFPECFDGRVKTLNPYIHGGILHRRDNEEDVQTARNLEIEAIDLVCVNLYPFKETIEKTDDFEEIIENIDIGGPSMIRAAAKNFNDVIVVTDVKDYALVIDSLKNKKNTIEFRKDLMIKAYEHTAAYDVMIANYMNKRFNNSLGEKAFISGTKVVETRYGENPHQSGALYEFDSYFTDNFKALKGEPSFNNLTDINGAVKLASNFGKAPAVAIIKHANPCGFALKDTLLESYNEALRCDPISAYGGVVAINGTLDKELATKINEIFVEVIVAASVDDDALEVFASKKRIKIFTLGKEYLSQANDAMDFKHIDGGFVYQDSDKVRDEEIANAKCETTKKATKEEMKDLEVAYKIAALTKSNCVVYVRDSAMVGIGMGMTSRVDAAKCAIHKAGEVGLSLEGSALASEAFFPFRDSVDAAVKAGVKNIIQPGGSMRDGEVVDAANEGGISMYLTGVRHFLH